MEGVKHFSDFFKNNGKKELPKFDKEDILNDFFINESEEDLSQDELPYEDNSTEEIESTDNYTSEVEPNENELKSESYSKDEVDLMIQKEVERIKKETLEEFKANESKQIVLPINEEDSVEEEFEEEEQVVESTNSDFYKVYADKAETFSCEIELEGANLKDTEVRLVLESDNWNLMFLGEIDINGKVTIPIRKLNIFEEGTKGKIKMEVIAEGTVFTPWEDDFEVKMSKKVMVKFNENKQVNKPKSPTKTSVKVNLKK
jgi:hypothetical protein